MALDIASVQVRDSLVHYRDAQRDLDLTLSGLSLDGSNVSPDAAFPLQMAFELESQAPALTSDVNFQSRVRLGLGDGRYELNKVTLETSTQCRRSPSRRRASTCRSAICWPRPTAALPDHDARLNTRLHHPAVDGKPLGLSLGFDGEADLDAQTAQLRDIALSGDDDLDLTGTLSLPTCSVRRVCRPAQIVAPVAA